MTDRGGTFAVPMDRVRLEAWMVGYDPPTLDYLLGRPGWMDDGACAGRSDVTWFPRPGHWRERDAAKAVCQSCPVLDVCREWSLTVPDLIGIFGGTTEADRRRLRANRRRRRRAA